MQVTSDYGVSLKQYACLSGKEVENNHVKKKKKKEDSASEDDTPFLLEYNIFSLVYFKHLQACN